MPTIRLRALIPSASDLPRLALLFVAYTAAGYLGLSWAITPGAGTPIWPSGGIALAGLILGGPQLWPAIALGRFVVQATSHSPQPLWADFTLAVASVAAAVVPVALIRRTGGIDPRLGSLRDMARLILVCGLLGAVIAGAVGFLTFWALGVPVRQVLGILENGCSGYFVGVLLVTPLILAPSQRRSWRLSLPRAGHLAACLIAVAAVASLVFLSPPYQPFRTWHLFPVLVWAALAFSVEGATLALAIVAVIATWSAVHGLGPLSEIAGATAARVLIAQQFLAASAITTLVLAAVADERRGAEQIARSERRLRIETEALETLNATGALIAADLDLESVVQKVTDAGVALTGAKFGAFFYNVVADSGEAYLLYTLSGAPRSAFERFGMPRNTAIFAPTFNGEGVVRADDITKDPRYGKSAPHHGQPKGHLPVRSYLAAPVRSRSGEVLGGLFFGHPETAVFDLRAERLVAGLAGQAAIAIDNARLYQAAQREIAERTRAEEHQRLLINELNHRVKNTLATVQSIAAQTRRTTTEPKASYEAFIDRLMALSRAHDVLTKQRWEGAQLEDIVAGAIQPFDDAGRFRVSGPPVWLEPQTALALAMALHELATNAAKYGALSVAGGAVTLAWTTAADGGGGIDLELIWREAGGPAVTAPTRRGFGSRLLERGLAGELNGEVSVDYRPGGLVCAMRAKLPLSDLAPAAAAQ
ncbi:MAG: GAF domain-containing protein [Phenylobacterium sp.]|nr:MAG: GAF domain-containing protein [Phenylobacterium sp.]